MKDPIQVAGQPGDLVSPDDVALFEFINALRLSVRAKVAGEQLRGLPLSEIVVQVRELVRLAKEGADRPTPFPDRAFRAISRQAVAWCVEAYRPLASDGGNDSSPRLTAPDPLDVSHALDRAGASADRFPARSPTYRGLP